MNYVIAVGVFQALIAALLLRKSNFRSKADDLLLWLLLCIAAHLAIKFFIFTVVNDGEVRSVMNTFVALCYGPLLYLYALKKKDERFIPAVKWYLFLPFAVGAIAYMTVACVLLTVPGHAYGVLHTYNAISVYVLLANTGWFSLKAYRIGSALPESMRPERRLIRNVALLFLVLVVLSAVFHVLSLAGVALANSLARSIIYSLLVLCSVMILQYKYSGAAAPVLSPSLAPLREEEAGEEEEPVVPDKRSVLSADQQARVFGQLDACLRESRLFLDSELTLDRLAQVSGISRHHLSEVLNHHAGKSFYQYINEYRVREVQEKMHYFQYRGLPVNVLSLAYECGFKAKSSFNQYFKKITGCTPTEYLKSLQHTTVTLEQVSAG